MSYYVLEPEVGGNIFGPRSIIEDVRARPPKVTRLDYEFDGFPDDDIQESVGIYIVTHRLKQALEQIAPTGCEFDHADVSKSEQFEEIYPDRELPSFAWLKITGRAGVDDFGMTERHRLVVSERVLGLMQQFQLDNCEVAQYTPEPVAA